jgi:RNA polymerase sigma-70 factor (ECF subfamily)
MVRNDLEEQIVEHVIEFKDKHYRLAYSYVKNVDDALDIVQESISKAFAALDSLKNPSHLKTWFYGIVVNTSLDFLRKKKREVVLEQEVLSNTAGEYDSYENFDLKNALNDLPESYRIIIILRFFEDLKIQDIAEILNENVSTVKSRLYAGLKKMHIKMNREV